MKKIKKLFKNYYLIAFFIPFLILFITYLINGIYWKSDTSPLVKLVNINVKPALNKKFVLAGGIFAGLFLGILIAFIKEFSKSLDWKDIKSK